MDRNYLPLCHLTISTNIIISAIYYEFHVKYCFFVCTSIMKYVLVTQRLSKSWKSRSIVNGSCIFVFYQKTTFKLIKWSRKQFKFLYYNNSRDLVIYGDVYLGVTYIALFVLSDNMFDCSILCFYLSANTIQKLNGQWRKFSAFKKFVSNTGRS